MSTLSNKVGIVTGAGSGIGRASALALARRGASVVVAEPDGVETEFFDLLQQVDVDERIGELTDARHDHSESRQRTDSLLAHGLTNRPPGPLDPLCRMSRQRQNYTTFPIEATNRSFWS